MLGREALLTQERIDAVRILTPQDIRRAAEAFNAIAREAGMRAAPAHDIADKRTPVDADGNILALEVFGWNDDERVWWRNSRIALDSPLTTACRFEGEPFWVNAEGFHTRQPNPYLDSIDISNFEHRAMTRAAIAVPVMDGPRILATFDGALADHAVRETKAKYLAGDELVARLRPLIDNWADVTVRLREQLTTTAELTDMLRRAGAPSRPEDISLTFDDVRATFPRAMYYRSRYTALDVAWELGIFDELVAEVFDRIWA